MELRQLRYFVAMAEAGSLMKASDRLHVAQPALSVHLSNLETELGVCLVERSNRGIMLTEEGHLLFEHATEMLRFHDEAIGSLARSKAHPTGRVSLGLPSTLPGQIAPALYKAIADELPDVSLYIVDATTAALYEWLNAGRLDLVILCSLPDQPQLDTELIYVEELCLVGASGNMDDSDEVDFDELLDFDMAMPCSASSWRRILNIEARERGRTLKSTFETESASALRALALSGQCHVILPGSSVREDVAAGHLRARRIVNPDMRGYKSLARLNCQPATAVQQAVWDLVSRVVRQEMCGAKFMPQSKRGQLAPRLAPGSLLSRNIGRLPSRKASRPKEISVKLGASKNSRI